MGGEASQLVTRTSGQGLEIAIRSGISEQVVTQQITGGELGGLLQLRRRGLNEAQNQLGLVFTQASYGMNTLHKEGIDLNGLQGGDFFTPINDRASQLVRAIPAVTNESNNTLTSVVIDDPGALTGSNYTLRFNGAGSLLAYQVIRDSDGQVLNEGAISNVFPQSITIADGFTINLESGDYQSNDQFIIRPGLVSADSVELLVADPASLALALPASTSRSVGNIGNGVIAQIDALTVADVSPENAALISQLRAQAPSLAVRFTSTSTYDILDASDPTQPVQLSPPLRNLTFLPGRNNSILDFDVNSSVVTTPASSFAFTGTAGFINTTDNDNPGEVITFTRTNPDTGAITTENITVLPAESAATAATRINTISGVSAQANTELTLTLNDTDPTLALQPRLNGVDLTSTAQGPVPDPLTVEFLAERINQLFVDSGIVASVNGASLSIRSLNGEDLTLQNFGAGTDSIDITSNQWCSSHSNVD